ncbi:MAG: ATP-binding protein [Prolixibacteraceae bacterium]|jgi:two-component system nitrogen regulation sensor histidine kinase NtrY|nr:ATP-binding protein [Prolixibacteraceae bacterium]
MRFTKHIRLPFILFIVLLAAGILSEGYIMRGGIDANDMKSITRTLHRKQIKTERILSDAALRVDSLQHPNTENIVDTLSSFNSLFKKNEISLLAFKNDELIYWSDNFTSFAEKIKGSEEGLIQLPNGWHTLSKKTSGNYTYYGLILIKYAFKIENKHLENSFAKGFNLPDNFEVHFYPSENSNDFYSINNHYLFSIKPSGNIPCMYQSLYLPTLLYAAAMFLFFILLYRLNIHYFHQRPKLKLLFILLVLSGLYLAMNEFELPKSVFLLNIFSPVQFAYSPLLASLGGLIILSVFIFFWGICFTRTFDISQTYKRNTTKRRISLFVWLTIASLLMILVRFIIKILIFNSNISLAVYRIEEISIHSFAGFLIIGLLFFTIFFIISRIVRIFKKHTFFTEFLVILVLSNTLITLMLFWLDNDADFRLNAVYWLVAIVTFYIFKNNSLNHRLSFIVVYSSIFTIMGLSFIIRFDEKHEQQVQELMAANLSSEHDPTAELFLRDIDAVIETDTFLMQELYPPFDFVANYLEKTYFGGYLREYDLQFTICQSSDSVIIQPDKITKPCFPFFDSLLVKSGEHIPGTNFYYLDNMNGRITYFGEYNFLSDQNRPETSVFIELNSKLYSEGLGFPELLLPAYSMEKRLFNSYSFAKYNNGELVDRGGEYSYALNFKEHYIQKQSKKVVFQKWDQYIHCIHPSGKNMVIVSRKALTFYDYLIAFPYLFIFLFALSVSINFITRPKIKINTLKGSLRLRIQSSIVGVVFIALLFVGSGTIFYNINQYQSKHREDLIDVVNAVSSELEVMLGDVNQFDEELTSYLDYELVNLSDIFWTDINLYGTDGKLISTSRPEVFERGLISTQMQNNAYTQFVVKQPTRILLKEHIGKLKYLSAYIPLTNSGGDIIAYLNLPYFTKEKAFRQETTTFILAFINLYVFLLLGSVLVAFFISARITDPLRLIRENLSGMQLGKKTEPIRYISDDEIGLLVSEYNKKLEELSISADLLARSERETAWREMAKQIAHEIKNPLTPMKLNIQFLQRTSPSAPDYSKKVEKVTNMLIEQINNLSAIASEFSNFAKIPRAKKESFNLTQRLSETIELYDFTGQVSIKKHFSDDEEIFVLADKEQLSRAVINLIRNSIQSIPEGRKGKISINLTEQNEKVIITIKDNGKGIPEYLKESIFVPNFTTKSSGTGLGLAITKNIIENFNGKIWFESDYVSGTAFYIELPTG